MRFRLFFAPRENFVPQSKIVEYVTIVRKNVVVRRARQDALRFVRTAAHDRVAVRQTVVVRDDVGIGYFRKRRLSARFAYRTTICLFSEVNVRSEQFDGVGVCCRLVRFQKALIDSS